MYPFGYGLSYSSFEFGKGSVKKVSGGVKVSFTVKNTGKVPAAVVPQVYVAQVDPKVPRPHHELKAYEKLVLKKGETSTVSFVLPKEAFSRYDSVSHAWVMDGGLYRILIGDSASDLKIDLPIKL